MGASTHGWVLPPSGACDLYDSWKQEDHRLDRCGPPVRLMVLTGPARKGQRYLTRGQGRKGYHFNLKIIIQSFYYYKRDYQIQYCNDHSKYC